MQQILLGMGAVATKTYVDDIFSTFLYKGTGSPQTITNGIDLSGEGGMTWIKSRDWTRSHNIYDTVRGTNKVIYTESTNAEVTKGPSNADSGIYQFNNNGFNIGAINGVGANNYNYSSWTFRKAPGFFDVVTYTGTGSAKTVAHSLGSVPGMIMVKNITGSNNWAVYHKSLGGTKYLRLNSSNAAADNETRWNDTDATATHFSIGDNLEVNQGSNTFVAYLFAGGESTAAAAKSVKLDGVDDVMFSMTSSSSDFTMGTGDFTVECWFKPDVIQAQGIFQISPTANGLQSTGYASTITAWIAGDDTIKATASSAEIQPALKAQKGVWQHIAVVRNSGTTSLYVNGNLAKSASDNTNYDGTYLAIGGFYSNTYLFDGNISNFRVVKGTAVYTSSFRPPTEPLTNISGTVFLACQNSSAGGYTVIPSGVGLGYYGGNAPPTVTLSDDSPFDDPAGFVFGENEDQNVIKCGSYVGNGSSTGPKIHLGWEPQFLLVKCVDKSQNWTIVDPMRGLPTAITGSDAAVYPNSNSEEEDRTILDLTSTGFQPKGTGDDINGDGDKLVYMAIRRPDGYVGKTPQLGTDIFTVVQARTDGNTPKFVSNGVVDFAMFKNKTASSNWFASARLMQGKYLTPNLTSAETANQHQRFEFMNGYNTGTNTAGTDTGWMWKRNAGFDVVAYEGNGDSFRQLSHSMNNQAQMIWTKNRSTATSWKIWHKDLNGGGSNAAKYNLDFETTPPTSNGDVYGGQAGILPTSTHWTIGGNSQVNENGSNHLAMLFSSVEGISKVGSYQGNGSASGQAITLGFQPRYLILKASNNYFWVLDTTRGWGSGNDHWLSFDLTSAGSSSLDFGAPTSTGFTVPDDNGIWNDSGTTYLYYAHA